MARATGGAVERRSEIDPNDVSMAVVRRGAPRPSAPKRDTEAEHGSAKPAPVADIVGRTDSAPKRRPVADLGGVVTGGGTEQRQASRFADEAPVRSRTRSHVACGSAGRAPIGRLRRRSGIRSPSTTARGPRRWGDMVRRTASAPKRFSQAEHGAASSAATPNSGRPNASAPKRQSEAEHRRASHAVPQDSGWPGGFGGEAAYGSRARRRAVLSGGGQGPAHRFDAEALLGGPSTAPRHLRRHRTAASPTLRRRSGVGRDAHTEEAERVASPAKRQRRPGGDDRGRGGMGGVLDRATWPAGPRFEADRRDAARTPVRGGSRFPTSAAKRLAYAAGLGAAGPVEHSPALERHLAALSWFGSWPGSRSRYIPAVVKREVWRRDQGCCSYVDPHSGRRCGSRYRLEIDHIVPFALGGGAEPGNLRLRCEAHHRLRHAHRPARRVCAD